MTTTNNEVNFFHVLKMTISFFIKMLKMEE